MNSSDARSCGEIGKEGYWSCGTGSSKAASDPSELVTSTGPESGVVTAADLIRLLAGADALPS
jgi:hypothetical protein